MEREGASKSKNDRKMMALVPVLKSVSLILENFMSFSFRNQCVAEGYQTQVPALGALVRYSQGCGFAAGEMSLER